MNKIKVGVLMGGMSIEREVSFNSGRTICDHLDTSLYEIIPIFQTLHNKLFILPWKFLYRGKISDFEYRLNNEATEIIWDDLKTIIDFAFIIQFGRYAEDGCLQGLLEVLRIPYFGSKVQGSALGMNKIIQKQLLNFNNITTPRGITCTPYEISEYQLNPTLLIQKLHQHDITFPVIIKPAHEGSSLGISVVFTHDTLLSACLVACNIHFDKQQSIIIEEKIEGMEFSCIILTDYITNKPLFLPPTETVYEVNTYFYDYTQKYMPGKSTKFTPARCSQSSINNIQNTCLQVMNILKLTNLSRIDGFLKKDGTIVIIDPNSFTGTAPSSFIFNQAAEINMNHTQLINHLIATELSAYKLCHHNDLQNKENIMEKKENLRIAVLIGGASNEKEISLESGRNICYKLSASQYTVIPIFVDSLLNLYHIDNKILVHNSTQEIEHLLDKSKNIKWHNLSKIADFVFIALHGGVGENGSIQGILEIMKIPYNGSSVTASAICMDKFLTSNFLKSHNFITPNSLLISKIEWQNNQEQLIKKILKELPFPLIIKPHDDGCSVMVSKITSLEELLNAMTQLFTHEKSYALIEEYIYGMELTIGVIGNENPIALPPSQTVSTYDILSIEEKFLPGAGENLTPAPLHREAILLAQQTAANAFKAIGCKGYARIDCFYQGANDSPTGKEQIVIIEINTLPALTPATCLFHQAAEIGMRPINLLEKIIELGIENHTNINLIQHHNQI